MFEWLKRFLNENSVRDHVVQPWEQSNHNLVNEFRAQLDEIARTLGANVSTRFNFARQGVELYDELGVVARVSIRGDGGYVTDAIVSSRYSLPDATKEIIETALSKVNLTFVVTA